ncbi:MAG: hypothetical protein M3032_13155 [Verrucomicrobiota bacterium]|nr:hypothetical protein [Verrucomicrobiota bacterium]
MDQIANVLQNYTQPGAAQDSDVQAHFNQVAQAAPTSDLAGGIASMFRSDQTPPFGQLVSQMFGKSNPNQRANLLNTLLSSGAGAGILSQIMGAAGMSGAGQGSTHVTPEMASRVPAEAVQQAAEQAEKHDPTIVDRVSQFYAEHPTLVQTLGTVAMSMAMSHLAQRRR